MSNPSTTKESLLKQVDALRDIARRSRRLSEGLELEGDRRSVLRHVEGIEESAKRIENEAAKAKTFVIAPLAFLKKSGWLA